MMPDMDGIDATAAIRAWENEQPLNAASQVPHVPIIALTANAVSGMKEMFLEKGFNDYLSKPIEMSKLDAIIAKWIPPEKQIEQEQALQPEKLVEDITLVIPGIDVKQGITMTGGTLSGYCQILGAFQTDAEAMLASFFNEPLESNLALFTTRVHAIKGAAGTIGALELSGEAAELEHAGKERNIQLIREKTPLFLQNLNGMVENIRNALRRNAAIQVYSSSIRVL
jgi:CheY-like chemotaxis protein